MANTVPSMCASAGLLGRRIGWRSLPLLDALKAGTSGWCTAAPNLRPQPCIDLYEAVRAQDLDTAQKLYNDLKPLLTFIQAGWPLP